MTARARRRRIRPHRVWPRAGTASRTHRAGARRSLACCQASWAARCSASLTNRSRSSPPVLFRFPAHCRALRVLALEPMRRGAGAIRRAAALRCDALQAHQAGLLEDDLAFGLQVLVELKRGLVVLERPQEAHLAGLDRF